MIDPAWAGKVQFYELLFGTWTVYVFLVLVWDRLLRQPLDEWRYALITLFGAGGFWINHYFQYAPFWLVALNAYTLIFLVFYWLIGIRGQARSRRWRLGALLTAVPFTVAFIGFEQIARLGVDRYGVHEFYFMLGSFFGFAGVILWRGLRAG